jgi:hypothetical protein
MVVAAFQAEGAGSAVVVEAAVAAAVTAEEKPKGGTVMRADKAISGGLVSLLLLIGCTNGSSSYPTSGGGFGYGPATADAGSGAATQPMLVDVDTNRTMTAQPGEGVGIFTEYAAGGHWHVWWTCDTNQTGAGCSFDVSVTMPGGTLTNVTGEGLSATDQLLQPAAALVQVITQTSTGVAGVTFDTTPGSIVTLDARMNGVADGHLLFFVQAGQVNGGYKGMLTDPLMFEPSTP